MKVNFSIWYVMSTRPAYMLCKQWPIGGAKVYSNLNKMLCTHCRHCIEDRKLFPCKTLTINNLLACFLCMTTSTKCIFIFHLHTK